MTSLSPCVGFSTQMLLCTTALIAIGATLPCAAFANPDGGIVIGGSASIESTGPITTIHQSSDRAIVRWNSFDVVAGERVDFQQPTSSSITVNRIQDSKASRIDGRITANGNVLLLNQNGIVFGAGAQVDVGGIIASTSDLENDDAFMAGGTIKLTRLGSPDAKITNSGTMTVQDAGLVGLIAPQVENHGVINARFGKIALASGDISTIDLAGDGLIQIQISDSVQKQFIQNTGNINADGGVVQITAAAARSIVDNLIVNEGHIQANTLSGHRGSVNLSGSQSTIQNTGTIKAEGSATEDAGSISINGQFVSLGGTISANGKNGGSIDITAQTLSLADTISANGLNGAGGIISIQSQTTWETSTSFITANGSINGGKIRHFADQQIISSGHYQTNSTQGTGGHIDISGWSTKFLSAQIDANGHTGGGTVRLGGEYQGGSTLPVDEMPNSYYLIMDRGTRIRTESTGTDGDGGTTILWSDGETVAMGNILAKPGTQNGNGGFVEVSSGQTLKFDATTETGRDGRIGSVLLDPKNILISDFSFNSTAIILGYGYQGGRTNQDTNLDGNDGFGLSVSLDGNRAAIGSYLDDGLGNIATNTGAVYLFSYTDASFSGGVLEGIIGKGYTGGKNIDLALDNNDQFGYGVSLDGNRLAVGALGGDGSANSASDTGDVYLFSFTDSAFSGGNLEAQIGRNYTGGKNINVTTLNNSDYFGSSLSLDGTRLAISAYSGDGSGNTVSNSGEVYLFTFSDTDFNIGTLAATIGNGYSGGKNINVGLDTNDYFGYAVSLDGTQLAIGAHGDDGLGNSRTDAGAVYLFNFSDSVFSGGALQSTVGYGYTGGKNINLTSLDVSDQFGNSVSLNNNRFAAGAWNDDAYSNVSGNAGAVYLFTTDDSSFNNITQQGKIGYQYREASKDFDLSGLGIGGSDAFGSGVSLDGNRLIIGSYNDDGLTNSISNMGAFYSFTFSDASFSGATLEGITGSGYIQGKNINVPTLSDTDNNLGTAVSISGTRLAVGNYLDDGFNSRRPGSGAVYLYSFSDTNYSGGTLQAIIGDGYTGGKNYNQALRVSDGFGVSVSLDGNRLAVGSYLDDGLLANNGNAGAAYLYSFSDALFSSIALESRIGYGYNGAKDINVALGNSDLFGYSVSLNGNRLAVGAYSDDGFGNGLTDSGAVYLFTFADSAFNGGSQQAIIGQGYTGGKNINNLTLDVSDTFGFSVALNGTQLAVGTPNDDGFGNSFTNSGTAYLYNFSDSVFSGGVISAQIGNGYTGGKNINMAVTNSDAFGAAVGLSNNNLFVGAYGDDGFANSVGDSGAVFRYSFTDSVFSGGALAASIGARYIGTNDYDLRGHLTSSDFLGRSLSVDGQNLVIGATLDDGFGNNAVDSGAIYLFQYTDMSYQTPVLKGLAGAGYDLSILAKGIASTNVKENDFFGNAVSLDGNRMVVGSPRDDGFNDVGTDRGAVYLYSFTDSTYSGGVLEGIIGQGYTGGKNINLTLGNSDYFGSSVSLDGNRLAVGAYADDGSANALTDSGAVYLFTFTDSVFTGGSLAATLGKNYTGGKNINLALDTTDYFGWSVSLDGNRLAVGAQRDDGSANAKSDSGAIYLFTFTDSIFTGGALTATIGHNYTGGKNINTALDSSDYLGSGVSLDGTMLAVGVQRDDGNANSLSDSGAVYYYTFTDSVFTGGTLQGKAGFGYTGGKNINVTTLEASDWFGSFISLNSNRLAVGIEQDDGFGNQAADSGAVSLYSFTDSLFSSGSLQGTIGYKYTGGKNFDLGANFISEYADRYSVVSLDGNRILIGGYQDDAVHLSNAGAVAMLTFSDAAFNGTNVVGITGNGYTGSKNISFNPSFYSAPDSFGNAVSLNSNRLAVGVSNDDGNGDGLVNGGSVYLYSIPSGDYDAIALEGIVGYGYTGGKNIDLSSYLDRYDFFGTSVSLDSNRLAVGAYADDGRLNDVTNAGAVYLFSFADNAFSSGTLQSRIGNGYTGGKNISIALGSSDYFGWSVSLDGNRLAIGAQRDDGLLNNVGDAGSVYLYNFTDSVFSGGALQGTIGYGYTGGKNYNLSTLNGSDFFGNAVSLDGNRLAIGSPNGDGVANGTSSAGEVYLFTFSDSAFSSPTLQGTIGSGYTGPKDYNMSSLFTSDVFGTSVALDGTVLAIGANGDQGYNLDTGGRYGALFIFSFADSLFSTPFYDSTIGLGYTGGKNISTGGLAGSFGGAISLDSGTLVAGASGLADVTGQMGSTGRVYIYRDSLSPISYGSSFGIYGGSTIGITAASIAGLLSTPQNVTLQASNDITLSSALLVNNGSGNGGILTLQAGRSIYLNASIDTDDADLNILANENLATGVINTQRDAGTATISMGAGTSINAGSGTVTFRIDSGAGKTNSTAGGIALRTINAGAFRALSGAETGNITTAGVITATNAGDAIILDAGANFINTYGVGALVAPSGRWLVYSDHSDYTSMNGLNADFSSYRCTYGGSCIITIPPTGNGLLYQYGANLLTVTLNTSRAYGAANPNLATMQSLYQYTGFQGADTVSVLDVLPTATIASAANTTANAGTTHAITFSGGSDNYYDYYFVDGLLTITKKDITATWNSPLSKIYGGLNPSVNTSNFTYTGLANSEPNSVITASAVFGTIDQTTAVGTYTVGTNFVTTNYNVTNAPTTTLTINKRDITAAWTGGLSRIYGDANPSVTSANFSFTGLVNGDLGSVITPTADYGAITTSSNVATYTNGVSSTFSASNYNITNTPTTDLTINKRDITAIVDNDSRTYGDANPSWTWADVTWGNLANSETGSVIDALTIAAPTALATSNAGTTHAINLSGFSDNNYNLTTNTSGTLTINKRDITAAVDSKTRAYGDANPSWAWTDVTWGNLANSETGSVLDTLVFTTPTPTSTSNAGTTQSITITSFLDNNYNLTSTTSGTLTINKRDITAIVDNDSRAYGDANPSWTWADVTWGNLANSETGSVIDALTIAAPTALATSNAGTTHAINLSGFSDNNYNLTTNTSGTLTINKRDITATVGTTSRYYGYAGTNATWSDVVWSNLANSETGAVIDSLTFSAPTADLLSIAGTNHTLNIGSFSDNNYNLTGSVAGLMSVSLAPLILTVNDAVRPAQTPNPSFSYTLSGLRNTDDPSVVTGVTLETLASQLSFPGHYAITASGGTALNYTITSYIDGDLVIGNANNIPSTVEQTISGAHPIDVQSQETGAFYNPNIKPTELSQDNYQHDIIVIPDNAVEQIASEKRGIIIAITQSLKKYLGFK